MVSRRVHLALALAALSLGVACSQEPRSPLSPSATDDGTTAAAADGSTLKVSAPVLASPVNGDRTETVRPTLTFQNSIGRYTNVPVIYRIELLDTAGQFIGARAVPQASGPQTSYEVDVDLANDVEFQWRVRAEYEGQAGPWSAAARFRTPQRVVIGDGTGPVGPRRNIGFNETYDILFTIYQAARWNISGGSSRDQMNLFLEASVGAVHYGHPRWNPRGGDTNWCIKTGGPGRPQSDDVIVRCDTRDAWDLIGGIGGPGATWSPSYIGVLPGIQQVYPPNAAAMRILP